MINELLQFEESLNSWGITLDEVINGNTSWHSNLMSIPKKIGILALVDSNGNVEIQEFPNFTDNCDWRRYYYLNNHNNGIAFKFPSDDASKSPDEIRSIRTKRVASSFKCTSELWDELYEYVQSDNLKLNPFTDLVERLPKVDINKMVDDVVSYLSKIKALEKPSYVVMDVNDDNRIYTKSCMSEINRILVDKSNSGTSDCLDFFGQSDDGFEDDGCFFKIPAGKLTYYSKNKDNKCYTRFGKIGSEACKIGSKTRAKVSKIAQFIFSEDKKFSYGNNTGDKLWFEIKDNKKKYIVASSIMPKDRFIQTESFGPTEYFKKLHKVMEVPLPKKPPKGKDLADKMKDLEDHFRSKFGQDALIDLMIESGLKLELVDWERSINSFLETFDSPNHKTDTKKWGKVIVIDVSGNGQAVLKYDKTIDSESSKKYVEDWRNGLKNNSSLFVPGGKWCALDIRDVLKILNKKWTMSKGQIALEDVVDTVKIQDVYEFLSNNPEAIKKFASVFSRNHVKTMIDIIGGVADIEEKSGYFRSLMFPFMNLLLYKLGIRKENFMDKWSYNLGRLFREANSIHRAYYTCNDRKPPAELIGHKFIQMSYYNPQRAFASFCKEFPVFQRWAENKMAEEGPKPFSLKSFRQLHETLVNLPNRMTDQDSILMACGYNSINTKQNETTVSLEKSPV